MDLYTKPKLSLLELKAVEEPLIHHVFRYNPLLGLGACLNLKEIEQVMVAGGTEIKN